MAERYDRLVAALLPPAPESSLTPDELAIINGTAQSSTAWLDYARPGLPRRF